MKNNNLLIAALTLGVSTVTQQFRLPPTIQTAAKPSQTSEERKARLLKAQEKRLRKQQRNLTKGKL